MSKKVVLVIAEDKFRDEEFFHTKEVLEKSNVEVIIASTTLSEVTGMLGQKANPDILISGIDTQKIDALIFVGGIGASQYWDDSLAHKLAKDMDGQEKIVAAICIAPVTLANCGLLEGKRATVWRSEAGQLKSKGADYTGRGVEVDGNIITADGPTSARKFAEAIVEAIR